MLCRTMNMIVKNGNPKPILLIAIFFSFTINSIGQNFFNPDLNGDTPINVSMLPYGWQNVPFDDFACQATSPSQATPDLAGLNGPNQLNGLNGNPYSGLTFISGTYGGAWGLFFQEGIMQTVSGFNIGCSYNINFFQAVVKQSNGLDTSGSWSVYVDSILIGTTVPTISQSPYNSNSFLWEFRTFDFIATSSSHTIKFLPQDDDNNNFPSDSNLNGSLRMGIDSIFLTHKNTSELKNILGNDTTICDNKSYYLDATNSGYTYVWNDSSTNSVLEVTQKGRYWVRLTDYCGSYSDTINIEVQPCKCNLFIPDAFTPNRDNNNDMFFANSNCDFTAFHLQIYSRWGERVFEGRTKDDKWNGTYKGIELPIGMYYYILNYEFDKNGKAIKKGDVVLIR